ncbi:ABC transporter permease [Xylanimonas allomyrinae]|uniref:Transport permease protein n=1 Tax=Xylanimonas allomyrinae TaxID=2509459 RepID=A0A4P6EK41_9MICO|nr:ABC transporter permease [Xylanimonas allomyrinae]QAY62954.1 ABC transporter permease [Xylanimonas allomyrinae]
MSALAHTTMLAARASRSTLRVPVFAVMQVVQPLIWLLLFGQLFRSVVDIPGFAEPGTTYLEFITPGVVMMTAMFGAAWAGTGIVEDSERGVMDHLLASPASRLAIQLASLVWFAAVAVAQALVVLGVAWLCGARFDGGATGLLVLLLGVVLLTFVFAATSNAVALLTRQQEALIGISQGLTIPLMFLSSAVMDTRLSAGWVATAARFNPFDWAVVAGREALAGDPDWGLVWGRLGLLAALAVAMTALATGAFRAYRRAA